MQSYFCCGSIAVLAFKFCKITNHKGTNSVKYAGAQSCNAFNNTRNTKLYILAAKCDIQLIDYCRRWWGKTLPWIEIPPSLFIISNHLKTFSSSDRCGQKDSPDGWFVGLINQGTNGCCSYNVTAGLSKQTKKERENWGAVAFTGQAGKSTINCHSAHWGFTPQVKHQYLTRLNTTQQFINRRLQAENQKKKTGHHCPTFIMESRCWKWCSL